jgi:hypothetical protein
VLAFTTPVGLAVFFAIKALTVHCHCCALQGLPSMEELKLKYYDLMIRYYGFYNNYLEMTRCYKAVYEVESVQADPNRWVEVSCYLCFLCGLHTT